MERRKEGKSMGGEEDAGRPHLERGPGAINFGATLVLCLQTQTWVPALAVVTGLQMSFLKYFVARAVRPKEGREETAGKSVRDMSGTG
jgi:hypothetical protein